MKTQRRSRFTHPLQALSAEFSIIVWFATVIAQGENTKTKPIHAPSSGFPVSEFGIIIWFADVRAQANLSLVEICSIKYVQVQVHESQNGAVVLDGGVAAIAITVFGKTVFVLLRVCGRGYFGSWKGFFCVVIGKVCLREQFLINLICRDSASILRVELLA